MVDLMDCISHVERVQSAEHGRPSQNPLALAPGNAALGGVARWSLE